MKGVGVQTGVIISVLPLLALNDVMAINVKEPLLGEVNDEQDNITGCNNCEGGCAATPSNHCDGPS